MTHSCCFVFLFFVRFMLSVTVSAQCAMNSSKPTEINDLADEDLANIFKQLPPHERLIVSEVSKRWYGIAKIPWRDVEHLDLSSIPGENICAIIKHCPNLRSVFAKDKSLSLNQLHILSQASLSSLKLYHCSGAVCEQSERIPLLSAVFSDDVPNAPWKELVLCDYNIPTDPDAYKTVIGAFPQSQAPMPENDAGEDALPPNDTTADVYDGHLHVDLGPLRKISCLCLSSSCLLDWCEQGVNVLHTFTPTSLRELCLVSDGPDFSFGQLEELVTILPSLEVLFLNSIIFGPDELTKHPALRILCITGSFGEEYTVPVRPRFPNGFGSDPVPKLHVFVGKEPSENIIFTKSSADALEIHPITEPLPEFLEKKEIAAIFEGVWLAAQVKEGAKHGSNWWIYESDVATSFRAAEEAV